MPTPVLEREATITATYVSNDPNIKSVVITAVGQINAVQGFLAKLHTASGVEKVDYKVEGYK